MENKVAVRIPGQEDLLAAAPVHFLAPGTLFLRKGWQGGWICGIHVGLAPRRDVISHMLLLLPSIMYNVIKFIGTTNEVHYLQKLLVEVNSGPLPVPYLDPGASMEKEPQKNL